MWLREVVFQGVFGVDKAARIRIEQGFCSLALPRGIDPGGFRLLVLALLYPAEVPEEALRAMADGDGEELKIGLVVEVKLRRTTVYKVFRKLAADSIIVKDVTDGTSEEVLARGTLEAADVLEQRLFLPPCDDFRLLHTWDPSGVAVSVQAPSDPETARLLDLYRRAQELEGIEQRLDELRADVRDVERELTRIGEPLEEARSLKEREAELAVLDALSAEELDLIKHYDMRVAEALDRVSAMELKVEEGSRRVEERPLLREYVLWGTVGAAVVIYVLSVVTGLRALALLNILVLGASASTLLHRFSRIERGGMDSHRTQRMQSRLESLRVEAKGVEERMEAILRRASCRDLMQLRERLGDLQRIRSELQSNAPAEERDDEMATHIEGLRKRLDGYRTERERLEARRAAIDDPGVPTYELERDLLDRGLDPHIFLSEAEQRAEPGALDWFKACQPLAAARGLFVMGKMIEKASSSFNKLATHLAGPAWDGVVLTTDGRLAAPSTTDNELAERLAARPVEARLLLNALLSAIFAATAENHPLAQCRFVMVVHPYQGLPDKGASRLKSVLQSIASRSNVVVLQPAGVEDPT